MDGQTSLLHEELIFIDYEAPDRDAALAGLARALAERGYVRESYVDALLEREKVFPTGLATPEVRVAIPHTDPEHVMVQTILAAKLKRPVRFQEMSGAPQEIDVSLIFMLALKSHDDQLHILSKLMAVLSNGALLKRLYEAATSAEFIGIFQTALERTEEAGA